MNKSKIIFLFLFLPFGSMISCNQKVSTSLPSKQNDYGMRKLTFVEHSYEVFEKNFYMFSTLNRISRIMTFDLDSLSDFSSTYTIHGIGEASSTVSSFFPCSLTYADISFEYTKDSTENKENSIHLKYRFDDPIYQITGFDNSLVSFQYDEME